MILVAYYGFFYSILLLWKLCQELKGVKEFMIASVKVGQSLLLYVFLYMFDDRIKFVHDNAGVVYFSIIILYGLTTKKLLVSHMAEMDTSIINLEFLVFLPYFYLQTKYDGTPESEATLKLVFFATFATILVLYIRLIQSCITQISNYLDIYVLFIAEKKEKTS